MTNAGIFDIGRYFPSPEMDAQRVALSERVGMAWKEYNEAMDREIAMLLPMWVSEVDLPQLIFDRSGRFLGLGDAPEGGRVAVYVPSNAYLVRPPQWAMVWEGR